MITKHTGRLAAMLMALALVLAGAAASQASPREATPPTHSPAYSGTWYESAHATWQGASDEDYQVLVRALEAFDWRDDSAITGWLTDFEAVDAELVREVDPLRGTWRVDVPGLPRGTYDLHVRTADGTLVHAFEGLQTQTFPRHGAAFVPSNENPFEGSHDFALDGAIGAYLPDGRLDPAADVVYVTHETMNEALPADLFSARSGEANQRTPLAVRFLGTVGDFESVAADLAEAGTQVPPGAMNNRRVLGISAGNGNVTIEGVGTDATLYGWGISTGGAHNVVIRNLRFDQFFDDALEISGGGANVRASNVWVHHNTFGYGQNRFLNIPNTDPDQAKGDGATDIVNNMRNYTVAYNHYAGSSKTMLVGGGAGSISPHYGTVHHNWFQAGEERTPRVRNGRVHVFNNLYDDIQGHPYHDVLLERYTGYGIGAGHNATIWAEGNIFEDVNFPFLRSRQGHARGHQAIGYEPGPGESPTANAGFNHFFGDAPGFILTPEVVTQGDFPETVDGFRLPTDYLPGLTQADLEALQADLLALEPNVLDAASRTNFNVSEDIGVRVADGSTTTNPNMTQNPPAQLDWQFRPIRDGVWPTSGEGQAAALRTEIETNAGALPAPAAQGVPVAPNIIGVVINDETRSVGGSFIPEPLIVVHEGTFTIDWSSEDVLAQAFEIQWDAGTGEWSTLATIPSSARPTTFITQEIDQFAHLIEILARASGQGETYSFRVRALNAAGAGDWSPVYSLTDGEPDTVLPEVTLVTPSTAGPFRTLSLQVDATDNVGLARIVANIYGSDGTLVRSTSSWVESGATEGTHTATVTLPQGDYTIRYNAHDVAGNVSVTHTHAFAIDTTRPVVTLVEPSTAGPFPTLTLRVDATDNGGLARIVANIYGSDGTLVRSTSSWVDGAAAKATHTATVTLPQGDYTIRYNAHDVAGNVSVTHTHAFAIEEGA